MYQTSQEYKDSMKRPIRERSFMKVQLGLINQEAQQSASLENTDYNSFSDPSTLFNQHTVKRYATYEQNMFRADGTMYFLPKDNASYWKDGYTCTSLFNNELHIKFVFGYGKSDIKGLTIQFGENYPTKFSVMTDDGTSVEFLNNSQVFKTDTVFSNTASIELVVTEMSVPNNRVRIDYIQFGLGLEYDDEWILEANSKTSLSAINDDLPESEFSITLNNDEQIFNVDNPASEINFLESGQRMNVVMGYMLDNGKVEWLQMHSLYVYEWSASDEKATIKAVDVLKFLSDDYYKGQYYETGITLYDLAVLVLEDAGVAQEDYYLDTYLKKIIVHNPLPNVRHKEALQIIANAGRCVLDYDRYGRIRIHSLFRPECETTSNGTTDYSDVSSIDTQTAKTDFATYENNRWLADGKMVFLPKSGIQNTGYVSLAVSDENGLFTENPIITRTLEAKYKAYGIYIEFGKNLPKKFVIRAYSDNVLHDTVTIQSGIAENFELQYDFAEYDKIEIEFVETEPHNRIHVNYISLGSETAYKLEYDDLYSTPVGTQLDKIKNVKVARYLYSKSNVEDDLTSETLVYDGNNAIYYMTDACYGYKAIIEEAKSGQSIEIKSSGAYYVELAISGVSVGEEIKIAVKGYKYNVSTAYTVQTINNRGTDKEWQNPLISNAEHGKLVTAWLADYFASGIQYELDYRGEPAIDCGDTIGQENKYDPDLKTIVEESQITFSAGLLGGGLITRRKECVART